MFTDTNILSLEQRSRIRVYQAPCCQCENVGLSVCSNFPAGTIKFNLEPLILNTNTLYEASFINTLFIVATFINTLSRRSETLIEATFTNITMLESRGWFIKRPRQLWKLICSHTNLFKKEGCFCAGFLAP